MHDPSHPAPLNTFEIDHSKWAPGGTWKQREILEPAEIRLFTAATSGGWLKQDVDA